MEEDDLIWDLFVPDAEKAFEVFRGMRWHHGIYCPDANLILCKKRSIQSRAQLYPCNKRYLNFNDLTATIFTNKKIPLGKMFYILHNIDFESVKRLYEDL